MSTNGLFPFTQYEHEAFPFTYAATLVLHDICGGVPSDPRVIEGHIARHLGTRTEEMTRQMVASVMADRGIPMEQAAAEVARNRQLNGFHRVHTAECDRQCQGRATCQLAIRGYAIKAMLKEAKSIAVNEGRLPAAGWGNPTDKRYRKGIKEWFPEHVHVVEDMVPLGRTEPDDILQQFVHSRFGSAISYYECCQDVKVSFTIRTDHEFSVKEWAHIWLTGGANGLGANRSQGYGRFEVERFDQLEAA